MERGNQPSLVYWYLKNKLLATHMYISEDSIELNEAAKKRERFNEEYYNLQ